MGPGYGILLRPWLQGTKHLEHNGKEQSYPTVPKHPGVWLGEGVTSWHLPCGPQRAGQAERQQVRGPADGRLVLAMESQACVQGCTMSLCRVKSGPKTTDLKPLFLEVSFREEAWGARRMETDLCSQQTPHIDIINEGPHTCRCQKCGQVKVSLAAFSSQGTQFNQNHMIKNSVSSCSNSLPPGNFSSFCGKRPFGFPPDHPWNPSCDTYLLSAYVLGIVSRISPACHECNDNKTK